MEEVVNTDIKEWRKFMLVEPPIVLYFFAQAVAGFVTGKGLVYHSCQVQLGADNELCATFHKSITEGTEGQPYATPILIVQSCIDALMPAILALFLGSWSDKYGRKPILVAGYAGSSMSFLLWMILSLIKPNPWFYLVASVPTALVGGYSSIVFVTYSYITDKTSKSERAWHLTVQQSMRPAGLFLGYCAAPTIYREFGSTGVFVTASASCAISMLYVMFIVPETVTKLGRRVRSYALRGVTFSIYNSYIEQKIYIGIPRNHAYRKLFRLSLIKKMIATCVKKRGDSKRLVIWCCILSLSTSALAGAGQANSKPIFAGKKLKFGIDEYLIYQGLEPLLSIVSTLLGAKVIISFIDESMSSMGIVAGASTSLFSGAIAKSFANKSWQLYLSTSLETFGGVAKPVLQAALSKSVPRKDSGKVFSLAASMEAMLFLASGPLYTMIHKPSTDPSWIFGTFARPCFIVVMWLTSMFPMFKLWGAQAALAIMEE